VSGGNTEEGDLAATAWPGFVDILSSVLIMFVFFLMITAVALNFHTILFKSKIVASNNKVVEEQLERKVSETTGQLESENQVLKEQLAKAEAEREARVEAQRELETKLKVLQQAAQMAQSEEQTLKLLPAQNTVVVFYGADAISLTKKSLEDIQKFIKDNGAPGMKIRIEASRNTTNKPDQTARRVAVARMLNARNVPLTMGMAPSSIKASLVEGEAIDGVLDWVKIILEK